MWRRSTTGVRHPGADRVSIADHPWSCRRSYDEEELGGPEGDLVSVNEDDLRIVSVGGGERSSDDVVRGADSDETRSFGGGRSVDLADRKSPLLDEPRRVDEESLPPPREDPLQDRVWTIPVSSSARSWPCVFNLILIRRS